MSASDSLGGMLVWGSGVATRIRVDSTELWWVVGYSSAMRRPRNDATRDSKPTRPLPLATYTLTLAKALNRRRRTDEASGTRATTQTFAEKELLKAGALRRAERTKARRVEAEEHKEIACIITFPSGSRRVTESHGHAHGCRETRTSAR